MATIKDSANWASHQAYPSDMSMTWDKIELQTRLRIAFQKGARWQKSQIMKDAVEAEVYWYDGPILNYAIDQLCEVLDKMGIDVGDKVRIIIVKED